MELLTNVFDNWMTVTKIEDVNNKFVVSTAEFKSSFNVGSNKKSFDKKDVSNKNQFIIDSVIGKM